MFFRFLDIIRFFHLLVVYFFLARFFTKKRQKTLCVTIRNFARFCFVYLYAKITRFLINERRTYPYIQVVGASRLRRGTFRAPYFACLHTDFRGFYSIRNFTETARKSRCSPLNRLAKQRVLFCGQGFRISFRRLYVSLYFRQGFLRISFIYFHDYTRFIFHYPTPRKRDILIFRVIRFAY